MNENKISIFVSCSYDQPDREVVDFVSDLARAMGFEVYIADTPDIRSIPTKIREEIEKHDCFMAIATRAIKVEGKERWFTKQWILQEIGIASAFNKPLMIFTEKQVHIPGIPKLETALFEFDRETLKEHKSTINIIKFLSTSKEQLAYEISRRARFLPPYEIEEMRVLLELDKNRRWTIEREYLIRSILDELSEIQDMTWVASGEGFSYIDPEFNAFLISRSKEGKFSFKKLSEDKLHISWLCLFEPPLEKNEKVTFGWTLQCGGFKPVIKEEIDRQAEEGKYFLPEHSVQDGVTIKVPTKKLIYEIKFPSGYKISSPSCDVVIGSDPSIIHSKDETKRIVGQAGFRSQLFGRTQKLELSIENPLFGHTYQMKWYPPSENECKALFGKS